EVGAREELDVAAVLRMHRRLAGSAGGGIRSVRLVIGGGHDHRAAALQPIAERERPMGQILRYHAYATYPQLTLGEVVETDCGAELCERDGKVAVLHLSRQGPFELLAERARGVDIPCVAGDEERREERKALDVIPMGVGDHQVPIALRLAGLRQ